MMTLIDCGNYIETTQIPDWYKAENFDYCESFFEDRKHFHVFSVSHLIQTLLIK